MPDENNPPTSPTSPIAPFPPLPPTGQRSRAPEFYGFVAWTSTSLGFFIFLLWALLPDAWIVWLGIEWYPNREWAVLLPAYSVIVVLLTYFTYFALAIYGTPSFNDMSTVIDSRAQFPPETHPISYIEPQLYDIPIGLVNRVVYPHPSQSKLTSSLPLSGPKPGSRAPHAMQRGPHLSHAWCSRDPGFPDP